MLPASRASRPAARTGSATLPKAEVSVPVTKVLYAFLLVLGCCVFTRAPAAPDTSCHRPPPGQEVIQYQRVHDITIRRPARGPDAIEYEAVDVVSAVDVLLVWHPAPDQACVLLTTYDQNAAECGVDGLALKDADGEFVFSDEACRVRLSIGPEKVELRAPKAGCKNGYWARNGVMEDATYMRSFSSDR